MIILTSAQADAVCGHGANGSRLQPLEYQGRWLLPEAILVDPDYIDQRDFLSSLPTEDVTIEILDS